VKKNHGRSCGLVEAATEDKSRRIIKVIAEEEGANRVIVLGKRSERERERERED
jgi:hypothetical protein